MEYIKEYRYEKKFLERGVSKEEIIHIIKMNPVLFKEKYHQRQINNIYFDTINKKNYHENIEGNSERFKIRIRWYGTEFKKVNKPVLEIKIKKGELGRKLSFPLKPFVFNSSFCFDSLKDIFQESSLPFWLIEKLRLYVPALVNSYKRQYFQSSNKKFRITVDWDLSFFEVKKQKNLFNNRYSESETKIIELKYNSVDYQDAPEISSHLPFRLVASSKYVSGIDFLNN